MQRRATSLLYSIILLLSCKSVKVPVSETGMPPAAVHPSSCNISAQVLRVRNPSKNDTSFPCNLHPCIATVRIEQVYGCGSGTSLAISEGDTIEMRFAFTLDNTAGIFPAMKTQYPGLKIGDRFEAVAEQRLKPGSGDEFVIFAYRIL